ncbi:hypothetical protein, partial [Rhodococcus opacus]|uniref:hypothetical protein n=1 Tax=Rhodococcus opacus TaxID=37919 RepID=UPI0024B8D978
PGAQPPPHDSSGWGAAPVVLQRHLWEVSATSVVGSAGLVLSAPSPVRPGPDVLVGVGVSQDQLHEQAADLG